MIPLQQNSRAFKTPQTYGKAMTKVNAALPNSPRKKTAVVKKLALKFGLMTKSERSKSSTVATLEKSVEEFYCNDTVSRQLPGRKDYVIVRNGGKKEKMQRKVLIMTVMQAFKQYKTKSNSANWRIKFCQFTSEICCSYQ